jgi:hypothetical protein
MSQEDIELRGSSAVEIGRIDRILSQLARPAMDAETVAPSTRDALLQLGICAGGDASRRDLIEHLWGRKRTLMRRMSALGDWGPMPPVA